MVTGNSIGLVAVILNIVTLLIVLYQTGLSKKGFELSKISYDKDKKVTEMSMIPKMNFVIYIQMEIEKWIGNIKSIKEEMEIAVKEDNELALEFIANQGLKTCKGLVNRFYYEHSPNWLSEIYITGAKYYYYVFSPIKDVWDFKESKGRLDLVNWSGDSLIDRCDESEFYLKELLEYINDAIPDTFKHAPDSIPEDKFLSD